ncbi:somatolactin beta [Triplophysa dalaica]|uniref:somatolactin beta n=1 Tax=Triplophysa dalaica TaxID=1582913 RepID=UPI0024E021CE|nr:somatolactin beta [Triplophysa dalaica]
MILMIFFSLSLICCEVRQVCVGILLCSLQATIVPALDCSGQGLEGASCTISVEKLLDRAVQHAVLIYRISEESKMMFEEMFIPLSVMNPHVYGGTLCAPRTVAFPATKSEIQQISDKWLLHSVLILIQSWIDPLADLQVSMESYDNAPSVLLNRTKWLYTKLMSLEQGVLILIKQILGEGGLLLDIPEKTSDLLDSPDIFESVRRDYSVLYCFRKDAHKMETFLKLLKCRQTDKQNCSVF